MGPSLLCVYYDFVSFFPENTWHHSWKRRCSHAAQMLAENAAENAAGMQVKLLLNS
jgi:hypothetical protein